MINLLLVSTVFHKKQYAIISVEKETLYKTICGFKHRNDLVIYPITNLNHLKATFNIIDKKDIDGLVFDINDFHACELNIINFNGRKFKNLIKIEPIIDDLFRITTSDGTFISNSFKVLATYV